jgi:mono/diheme cytochrome c family protein
MKRDFKTLVILLAFSIPLVPMLFIAVIYFSNCGIYNNCARANLAKVIHTPIPTLSAATLPAPALGAQVTPGSTACNAPAATLLEAWVGAGTPENASFIYTDLSGNTCAATFAQLQPLFTTQNLWYPGALACTACHNANPNAASAGLDLSSYSGLLAGAGPAAGGAGRTDILGSGDWTASSLDQALFVNKQMPPAAPHGGLADLGPVITAGEKSTAPGVTPTAVVAEIPHPSNPGGPGPALGLTGDPAAGATIFDANCSTCHGKAGAGGVSNPGSTDGVVPTLNPIDPLLKNSDPKVFAQNIDLFIQHGSTPHGNNPFRVMPAWGDQNALTQQQIADVIAYVISLNK